MRQGVICCLWTTGPVKGSPFAIESYNASAKSRFQVPGGFDGRNWRRDAITIDF
ncbi:hypothetical protein ACVIKO_000615 [Rhizobium ruizarguesonis]